MSGHVYFFRSLIIIVLLFSSLMVSAQLSNDRESELAIGVKFVTRQFVYGRHDRFISDHSSAAIQPAIRYDMPVTVLLKHPFVFTIQSGFLFGKAEPFDTAYLDPETNRFTRERSKNPTYFPVYAGIYNLGTLSVGSEIFYWKGLGNRDIWGWKFLSLGYNGKQFRVHAAGELYAQPANSRNAGFLLSFDVFVKLIRDKSYKGQ